MATGSKFNIYITAFDKASGTINQINRKLAGMNEPVNKLGKTVKNFGKESGIANMVKGLENTAKAAEKVAVKVGSIIAPMATVFGIGSITAVAALSDKWGSLAHNITLASSYTHTTTSDFARMQGAARMMGIEAQTTSDTLVTFGQSLQDALYGRNGDYLALMNQYGIKIGSIGSGVRNEIDVLKDFADTYKKLLAVDGNAAHKGAALAGLSALEPLLAKGRKGIEEMVEAQKKFGWQPGGAEIVRGEAFYKSMQLARTSVNGLANSIGYKLMPVLQPMLEGFAEFMSENREAISSGIADFAKGFAEAIRGVDWKGTFIAIRDTFRAINSAIKSTIGWKWAIIGLVATMNLGLLTNLLKFTKGILGFILLVPRALLAIGLLTRAFVGLGIAFLLTPIGQVIALIAGLGFLAYEVWKHWEWFGRKWDELWDRMSRRARETAHTIAESISTPWVERRMDGVVRWMHRNDQEKYGGATTTPSVWSRTPTAAPVAGPYAGTASPVNDNTNGGKAQVDIVFHNAPKGIRSSVSTQGGLAVGARTQSSMPMGVGAQ